MESPRDDVLDTITSLDLMSGSQPNDNQQPQTLHIDIIFVLGSPGAGKGTLCHDVAKHFGYHHLSVGDYLRELTRDNPDIPEEARGGLTPAQIQANLDAGTLLKDEQIVKSLKWKLEEESKKGHEMFIVDGFPRTVEAARMFEAEVSIAHLHCSVQVTYNFIL